MRMSLPVIAMVLALGTLDAAAHEAGGADGTVRNRLVVHVSDLDLSVERDAKIGLQRIEQAARRACGGHRTFSSYTGRLDGTFEECRDTAIRKAVEQLHAPLVTQLYSATCQVQYRRCA